MSIQPLITFKAGKCDLINGTAKPLPTPGYVFLYIGDDELPHFCWRRRDQSPEDAEDDLIMFPGDGSFLPYTGPNSGADSENLKSPTDGRIFVLKFSSSSSRHLFWLQSKSQHPKGDPSWFSERDLKIGQIVDLLLSGEDVDVQGELASIQNRGPPRDDDDETMEDVEGTDHSTNRNRHGSTGGAGPGATGGDIREEGEESREGGADGGRAAAAGSTDTSTIVQNFLNSLKSGNVGGQTSQDHFTTLVDLLSPNITIPIIERASDSLIDVLCDNLPPIVLLLAQEIEDVADIDPNSETAQMAVQALDQDQKKDILKHVLRSPQMRQSLGSLTVALRDGGLPNVSQALKIDVQNSGFVRGGGMPLGGGDAVKAFLEGVKKTVEKEGEDNMDTS
ncbi:hypothetical protein CC78DRAFT_534118 [Lojkania enalia]|uniref:Pru domain-containing protein n=1 Tax=Lojkania enalia TaxID=147567 RepID=A0A9P4KC34_9PLEO|nr:hypothetical protein CC78DRAFT_534118 [Didymosphaeria enalia]